MPGNGGDDGSDNSGSGALDHGNVHKGGLRLPPHFGPHAFGNCQVEQGAAEAPLTSTQRTQWPERHQKGATEVTDASDPSGSVPDNETDVEVDSDADDGALLALCGYRHCAAEAVRYLIEEENLSPDDPLVLGLQAHLSAREDLRLSADVVGRLLFNDGWRSDDEGFDVGSPDPLEDIVRMVQVVVGESLSMDSPSYKWAPHGVRGHWPDESSRWTGADDATSEVDVEQRTRAPCSPAPSI